MSFILTRRRATAALAMLSLAATSPLATLGNISSERPLHSIRTAAWVWNFPALRTNDLSAFAIANGIATLFVSIPMVVRARILEGDLEFIERLRLLSKGGIEVWALAGDPAWIEQPARIAEPLDALFRIQERFGIFHGLHVDIEPHAHPKWRRDHATRIELAKGFIQLLATLAMRANGWPIDAAIHPMLATLRLSGGATALGQAGRHVSSVSVMAYRDTVAATLDWVEPTIDVLQSQGVPWRAGVLVHDSQEQGISFSHYAPEDFRMEMLRLGGALRARYGDELYRGLAFEDYAGLRTIIAKQA